MLILITAIFLVSIAGVCASDVNDTETVIEDSKDISVVSIDELDENENIIKDNSNILSQSNDDVLAISEDENILGDILAIEVVDVSCPKDILEGQDAPFIVNVKADRDMIYDWEFNTISVNEFDNDKLQESFRYPFDIYEYGEIPYYLRDLLPGVHVLKIEFPDYSVSVTRTVTVYPSPQLTLNGAVDAEIGQETNLAATVTSYNGASISEGSVDFYVDGTFKKRVNVDSNGQATLQLGKLAMGNYTVVANYTHTSNYPGTKASIEKKFSINKKSTEIVANDTYELQIGNQSQINYRISPDDATGDIMFTSSNSSVVQVDSNGQVTAIGVGSANITINFTGTGDYASCNKNLTFNVRLRDASVSTDNSTLNLFFDENCTIHTTTNPNDLNVTYHSNDTSVVIVDDEGHVFAVGVGNVTVTITIMGNGIYFENSTVVNVTVNKVDSTLTVNNFEFEYNTTGYTIVSFNGASTINAEVNGHDEAVVNVTGNTVAVSGLDAGNYTLTVTTLPDDNHNPVTETANITVNKAHTEILIVNETIDLKVGDETIVANLTPADAGNVTFTSSNVSVVDFDDEGNVIAQGKGQAIITVSFAGNNNYAAAENRTVTVTVSLNNANVTVGNDTCDLKVGEAYAINATKHPDTILLDITYTSSNSSVATVDEKGIVTAVGVGSAVITVEVGDDEIYAKNSTTVKVTVSKVPTEIAADPIAATYNANKDLVITLKDSNGNPIGGLNITVDLNGTKNYTTDTSGQVRISTMGLAANIYDVGISFNGTDKYLNCSNTTTVSIYKESSRVDTKPLTTDYNVHKYLVVGLKDNEGNPIRNADAFIEIHGVTYKCRSDDAGNARLIIRLNPGTYTAKITFDNVNYTGFTQYVTVIVKKLTPKLTAKKKTFKKAKKVKKYTVTLKANSKALAKVKLTLKVKGKTYKAKTNAKGKAVFKIKNSKT